MNQGNGETDEQSRWNQGVRSLKKYIQDNGNCNVPADYPENQPLAKWVLKQRTRYKLRQQGNTRKLTDAQITELEDIGFVWEVTEQRKTNIQNATKCIEKWKRRIEELKEYKKENGDCRVPVRHRSR